MPSQASRRQTGRLTTVAIVGAGPAGSWAARSLARRGFGVTLFDGSHPREKPCGGGITARATALVVRELGRFPVPGVDVTHATFASAIGVASASKRRRQATIALSMRGRTNAPTLLVVNRDEFDRSLLDAACEAGAIFVPERVLDVDVATAGATVRTAHGQWTTDVLIGADGANSLVRRRLAQPFARGQLSVGAGCYVHGVASREIAIRWMKQPPGYLWSFPRHDRLAVGSCAQFTDMRSISDLKADVADWLHDVRLVPKGNPTHTAPVALESYSWPIPALGASDLGSSLPLAGDRWMLVGDAAGLVDPLTREGIFYALHSSALAADALSAGSDGTAMRYREAIATRILPELRRAARAKDRFFTPEFSGAFVAALTRSRSIRRIVIDLVAGEQPYVGLKRRLAATGRLDLALRALFGYWPEPAVWSEVGQESC
jgi:geranylgeranyl reductase family protein